MFSTTLRSDYPRISVSNSPFRQIGSVSIIPRVIIESMYFFRVVDVLFASIPAASYSKAFYLYSGDSQTLTFNTVDHFRNDVMEMFDREWKY